MSEHHRKKLAELVAESKKLTQQSIEISGKLAEIQEQIEARTRKLLEGKPSSHEMPAVDPPAKPSST